MTFKHVSLMCLSLALLFSTALLAQSKENGSIKGIVTTSDGKPAAAVTIKLKNTNKVGLSEEDGRFVLRNIKPGNYELEVTLMGFQSLLQALSVKAGNTTEVQLKLTVSNEQLQEVIVKTSYNRFKTADSKDVAKMSLSNLENPQVYTTVSKELLQQQGLFSADEAIRNSPGISKLWSATNRAGDGGAIFTMRGFTVQSQLRNGLAGAVTTTTDATNLERLEIIKGPSGTLYGSSLASYGGLINRVTKKPYAGMGGEISYATGSYDLNRISADINTPLDTAKTALLRINTAYNSMGSFQDNGFSRSFAFDPSFSYKINGKLTLYVESEINHFSGTTPTIYYFGSSIADLGVDRADKVTMDYKKSYQSNDLTSTSDVANFYGLIEYKISDHWKSQTNFSTANNRSSGYQPYFYLNAGDSSVSRYSWSPEGGSHNLQIQQNFVGDFSIGSLRNRIVAGLDFLNQKTDINFIMPSNGFGYFDVVKTRGASSNYGSFSKMTLDGAYQQGQYIYASKSNYYIYSAYVSDVLNITDNLMAMASLRVDHFNSKAIYSAEYDTYSQPLNQTRISPKFGLVYQVVKDKVSLFGNYMNGFSNPSLGLSYDATRAANVSKMFKSEQANQWEGGVKLDVLDGKLSITISYYNISVKDVIRSDAQHPNASVQDGTQYSKGVEVEVNANPIEGFNLVAGYAHNSSKMEKSDADYDGRRPQTAGPADLANFWASYTIPQGNAKGLGIGFGGNYASKNIIINSASQGVFYAPSYTVLNAGIYFNQPKFRIAINVNNLTDKKYWTGYSTITPQMLRQIIGSIAYKF